MLSLIFSENLLVTIFTLFLFIPIFAGSNDIDIELSNLEKIALENNLNLMAKKSDSKIAKADITTAGVRPNPTINLFSDRSPADKHPMAEFAVFVPIETAGKRKYRIEASKLDSLATEMSIYNDIRNLLYSIRIAYLDCLEAKAALEITEINFQSFEKLMNLNKIRLDEKQISMSEFSRSYLAYREAEFQKQDALLDIQKTNETLRLLLGAKEPVTIQNSLTQINFNVKSLSLLLEEAMQQRPDLIAMAQQKQGDMARIKLQQANAYPNISVGPDYQLSGGMQYYGVVAVVPLPIFDRNQGEIKKAEAKADQSQKKLENLRNTIQSEINIAYKEYELNYNNLQKYHSGSKGILSHAISIKNAAELNYKSGQSSLFELLDAIRTYSKVSLSYNHAINQYNKSIYTLDLVTGADNAKGIQEKIK